MTNPDDSDDLRARVEELEYHFQKLAEHGVDVSDPGSLDVQQAVILVYGPEAKRRINLLQATWVQRASMFIREWKETTAPITAALFAMWGAGWLQPIFRVLREVLLALLTGGPH